MKKIFIFVAITIILSSCNSNDDKTITTADPLPAATQTGANTFGCIINGQVFYPRDGQSSLLFGGTKGLKFWGDHTLNQNLYNEIEVKNAKDGLPASDMIIHLQGLHQSGAGNYSLKATNFQNSIDGLMQNYIYAKIYTTASGNWRYYGSYENSGAVTITRYDFLNRICSGTFTGKLRIINGTEEVEIQNGRFDLNWSTLSLKSFP